MCCWSVGLVQRDIEAAGFSTISLSMIPELTASAGAPRIAAIEHPFGVTLGRPGDAAGQLAVLRTAVRALEAMLTPGAIAHLPFDWTSREREALFRSAGRLRRLGRRCLIVFEGSRDLVSNWGCERLYSPIRHDRDALARRTHLTNHHNRNPCGLNGRQDRVRSVWRDGDQQRARRNQFQRIKRERTANRAGFGKHGNVLANDPKPETGGRRQLEEPRREPAFRRIVHRVHDVADIGSRESRTHDTDAGVNQETSGPRQKIGINLAPQPFRLLLCEDRGALDGHTACQ